MKNDDIWMKNDDINVMDLVAKSNTTESTWARFGLSQGEKKTFAGQQREYSWSKTGSAVWLHFSRVFKEQKCHVCDRRVSYLPLRTYDGLFYFVSLEQTTDN